MQYQINPHFLYNTLDSIAMSARRNQDRQSEEMTHALAEFFRIGLSHGAGICNSGNGGSVCKSLP